MNASTSRSRIWLNPLLGVFATGTLWWTIRGVGPAIAFGIAAGLLVLALALPPLFRPIQGALEVFGRWVAQVFSWIVLGVLYGLIFVPARLVCALIGRDPLRRKQPSPGSYWLPVEQAAVKPQYDKLY